MLASPPLEAPATTATTPANDRILRRPWPPLNRSPNNGTATITMSSGEIELMTAAIARDVSWNAAKPSVCAIAKSRPPGIAAFNHRHVSGAFTSAATRIITGTVIQLRIVAMVGAEESTARTNSGPIPQSSTTTATAAYPSRVSLRTRGGLVTSCIPSHAGQVVQCGNSVMFGRGLRHLHRRHPGEHRPARRCGRGGRAARAGAVDAGLDRRRPPRARRERALRADRADPVDRAAADRLVRAVTPARRPVRPRTRARPRAGGG